MSKKVFKKDEYVVSHVFIGSKGWLWFWIFMFFPMAIVYYFLKREPVRKKVLVR